MTALIDTNIISHRGAISEDALRARMLHEAYDQAGWLDPDGKPIKGCSGKVLRGTTKAGGYTIEIQRDLRLSDQARLPGPGK